MTKKKQVKKVVKRKIEGKTIIEIDQDTYDLFLKIYGNHASIPYNKKLKIRIEDEDEQPGDESSSKGK